MTSATIDLCLQFVRQPRLLAIVAAVLLGACSAHPPRGLEAIPEMPSQRVAQQQPASVRGQRVRWGGEIIGVVNKASSTEVEVFGRPLFDSAEPRPEGGEGIRFIAALDGFLDPTQYSPGKRLTVSGRLAGIRHRLVGEFRYAYPVVEVESHYLWPAYRDTLEPAAWRYPYYDPWWLWRPYRHRHYYW